MHDYRGMGILQLFAIFHGQDARATRQTWHGHLAHVRQPHTGRMPVPQDKGDYCYCCVSNHDLRSAIA